MSETLGMTTDEVMQELRISRATYWKYLKRYPRHFRTTVIGKRRYMTREALRDFLEFKHRIDSPPA